MIMNGAYPQLIPPFCSDQFKSYLSAFHAVASSANQQTVPQRHDTVTSDNAAKKPKARFSIDNILNNVTTENGRKDDGEVANEAPSPVQSRFIPSSAILPPMPFAWAPSFLPAHPAFGICLRFSTKKSGNPLSPPNLSSDALPTRTPTTVWRRVSGEQHRGRFALWRRTSRTVEWWQTETPAQDDFLRRTTGRTGEHVPQDALSRRAASGTVGVEDGFEGGASGGSDLVFSSMMWNSSNCYM